MHCPVFLTHPVAPEVLCPSLREERGGGRLRARGESKRGKTQNLLCLKYFQLTRRLHQIKVPGYRNIQPAGFFNCNLYEISA
jgi:hypothetical protein